ncbi:MAG: DUF1937 family protein [Lentisphaerae bacterium]|nr:DUF1937 family protein [Lentisphaerota bacterium]
MTYLASAYTHPDPVVREQRFREACRHAATLMREGEMVYSPIAHSHCIARFGLPVDWGFWAAHSRAMLARCDRLAVLELDGWETSVGVQHEIEIARAMGIPVRHIAPEANTPAGAGA